eukprot:CAMPEP_0114588448 /NCGR_PEP_ID=MMETSP0125-20121206/11148_1 /TAXON_ID=485358 ORGANISM="Aristerostoma sp., Strain ATCC 50986" /NCGR_SAMPLE_ID=MMETSP0125 /ASSEMBLY_ACC=CAM_ASM_000245 /LENGTH=477 /DNA_ID=CAMNT_0001784849 /DNA_START=51 /DNA_END=1484 /DNA_ORIENTATION=+
MGNNQSGSPSPQSSPDFNPEYEVDKKVHDAHYGEVKIVKDNKDESFMLLREINVDTKEGFEKILANYSQRVSVSHPNLVRVIGYTSKTTEGFCSSHHRVNVFVEILPKDLDADLKERIDERATFSEGELLLLAENAINALSYFQTQEIAHDDIRPFNIFVTDEGNYKLSDPGLNQTQSNALTSAILSNTKTFLTPDALKAVPEQDFEFKYDHCKADVYALGMTLLGCGSLSNSEELYDYEAGTLSQEMLEQRLEIIRNNYSNFTYELIRDMLNTNEEERPDFVVLSNRLMPYQEDIQKRVRLPFFKSHGFRKVAGGAKQYDLASLEDLEARIKAALERSHNTFKRIFGDDYMNKLEKHRISPTKEGGRNFDAGLEEQQPVEQEKQAGFHQPQEHQNNLGKDEIEDLYKTLREHPDANVIHLFTRDEAHLFEAHPDANVIDLFIKHQDQFHQHRKEQQEKQQAQTGEVDYTKYLSSAQ